MRLTGRTVIALVTCLTATITLGQGREFGGRGERGGGRGGERGGGREFSRGPSGGERGGGREFGRGPGGGPSGGGPGGGENRPVSQEDIAQRQARTAEFLGRLDANHNGIIEEEEAKGPERFFIERILSRLGMEAKFPLSISQAQESVGNYYRNQAAGTAGGSAKSPSGAPAGGPSSGASPGGTKPPGTLGFGVGPAPPSVPGFGAPPASGSSSVPSSGSPAGSSTSSGSGGSSWGGPEDQQIRALAKAIIQQNDKDGDGKLNQEEWSKQGKWGTFAEANRQAGDFITTDELVIHLRDYRSRGMLSSSELSGSDAAAGRKSSRFLSPKERLPEGLPEWFIEKDADADGQVSMSEYTREWTPDKASDFSRYDLNRDGIITPRECLKAEKSRESARGGESRGWGSGGWGSGGWGSGRVGARSGESGSGESGSGESASGQSGNGESASGESGGGASASGESRGGGSRGWGSGGWGPRDKSSREKGV